MSDFMCINLSMNSCWWIHTGKFMILKLFLNSYYEFICEFSAMKNIVKWWLNSKIEFTYECCCAAAALWWPDLQKAFKQKKAIMTWGFHGEPGCWLQHDGNNKQDAIYNWGSKRSSIILKKSRQVSCREIYCQMEEQAWLEFTIVTDTPWV